MDNSKKRIAVFDCFEVDGLKDFGWHENLNNLEQIELQLDLLKVMPYKV